MSQNTSPPPVAERRAHPFITYDMIFDIPTAITETLRRNEERAREVALRLQDRELVYLTGCGTAYFAAMLGAQFFPRGNGGLRSLPVEAFDLLNYGYPLDRKAVVGISHSGITKATIDALGAARAEGALGVGITHFQDSPINKVVDEVLIAGDSPDRSRCHTKCYIAGAVACAQLGSEVFTAVGRRGMPEGHAAEGLARISKIAAQVLRSMERTCEELAAEHLTKGRIHFVGSGPNLATALEAALKMKETSFVAAEGMGTEQFLHGPWVSLDKGSLVFIIAPRGRAHRRSMDLAQAARRVGAMVVGLVDEGDEEFSDLCDQTLQLPALGESLSPLIYIIPLYLFAYYASVKRGFNPDLLRYPTPAYWEARQIVFPPGTH